VQIVSTAGRPAPGTDREAPRYASRIFGRARFTVLRRPDQLPEVLIDVLRRLIRPCR
jgi:nitric oxide reductase activation protein